MSGAIAADHAVLTRSAATWSEAAESVEVVARRLGLVSGAGLSVAAGEVERCVAMWLAELRVLAAQARRAAETCTAVEWDFRISDEESARRMRPWVFPAPAGPDTLEGR